MTIWRVRVILGLYGADSQKPVYIYSSHSFVGELATQYTRSWYPSDVGTTTVTQGQAPFLCAVCESKPGCHKT